jgi:hypothetical protein
VDSVANLSAKQIRELGQLCAEMATRRAERERKNFSTDAQRLMLDALTENGPMTGEQLVDACKAAELRPADDRAFGSVIGQLSRKRLIRCVGEAQRKKGHGTRGASIWERV